MSPVGQERVDTMGLPGQSSSRILGKREMDSGGWGTIRSEAVEGCPHEINNSLRDSAWTSSVVKG